MTTDIEVAAPAPSGVPAPNTPSLDFNSMIQVSQMLAKSSLVPASYRGKPENVLLAALAGQSYGWDPTMAMRSFHVIEGQPSLKPEIMLALVRRAGHSVSGETSPEGANITGKRRDTGDTMTVTYTLDDARRAGLLNKSVWKQYPQSMCWARALSQLCRMLFPDVVLGAGYVPEELGATVDSNGEVIEVTAHVANGVQPAVPSLLREHQLALVKAYTENGASAEEAKLLAREAWSEAGLPLELISDPKEAAPHVEVAKQLVESVRTAFVEEGDDPELDIDDAEEVK